MARSQQKTTIAKLRAVLGSTLGGEKRFAKLAERSPDWVKKVSAGIIKLGEEPARKIYLKTGVSVDWLLGKSGGPPVNSRGDPYTFEMFQWYQTHAVQHSAGTPFLFAVDIAAIGDAAGENGKAALFIWKLKTFLDQCADEFGFSASGQATALKMLDEAAKHVKLKALVFHDKGMPVERMRLVRVTAGASSAAKRPSRPRSARRKRRAGSPRKPLLRATSQRGDNGGTSSRDLRGPC